MNYGNQLFPEKQKNMILMGIFITGNILAQKLSINLAIAKKRKRPYKL